MASPRRGRAPAVADALIIAGAPIEDREFAGWMAPLGPFEPSPALAVAVSGGADSLCLALLADRWARARGGRVLALIVDHGLRAASADEAMQTAVWLASQEIAVSVLTLDDLKPGTGMAARARSARFDVLEAACGNVGIVHLLLGHHAADQAETVLIRVLGQSGGDGMAAMAPVVEFLTVRVLRPLLGQPPARLRETLRAAGTSWIEDPSNSDAAALRPRLRLLRRDSEGAGSATAFLTEAAAAAATRRRTREIACAAFMAAHVTLRPQGFAILPDGPVPTDVLRALARMVSGSRYPPSHALVGELAKHPRPATFAGVRLMRWRSRMILLREARAMAPPRAAVAGVVWDGRFKLLGSVAVGMEIGALGGDSRAFRRCSDLPAAVLATLPALRGKDREIIAPHLGKAGLCIGEPVKVAWYPPNPAAGAWFSGD